MAPNRLQQQFAVEAPNQAWVTDITHIRAHEGWLYPAVVLDLFSRQVVGWSMRSRMDLELAIQGDSIHKVVKALTQAGIEFVTRDDGAIGGGLKAGQAKASQED